MKRTLLCITSILCVAIAMAQTDSFEEFKKAQRAEYNQFKKDRQAEFDAFRKQVNAEYAKMMRERWQPVETQPAIQEPEVPKIAPVVCEEPQPDTIQQQDTVRQPDTVVLPKKDTIDRIAVKRDTIAVQPIKQPVKIAIQAVPVIIPVPEPAPEPIAPVVEPKEENFLTESVLFYGTKIALHYPASATFRLAGISEKQLSAAWTQLSNKSYDVLVSSALNARKQYNLCDWAYIEYLQAAMEKHWGKTNEAIFAQAYLLTQSGYRVRLAKDNNQLYLLVASNYNLFNRMSLTVDGRKFFVVNGNPKSVQVCPSLYEKEKTISMQIASPLQLALKKTDTRHLVSKMGLAADVCVNKNLIDFYNAYPRSYINDDVTTTWATYANTPLEKQVKDILYPAIRTSIKDMSERDAVNKILNWVQTAFAYEYDDKVWGGDRAFFATETLYYPYCDCEDRAILFSRLVRDIVGAEVVLLYYPGHLAAAVHFKDEVKGDYLQFNKKKYIVCDPTFIGAGVGRTMPGMDNQKAKVILLQ